MVDSHVHLWDPTVFRMPWLDGDELLNRPYRLADFDQHTHGLVESIVYMQVDVTPAYGLLEARWAAAQAECDPRLTTIVAWAPLEDGRVADSYLSSLTSIDSRIKGVRRLFQSEQDPEFPVRPGVLEGLRRLPRYGLSFDICIRHDQLARTIDMVRACPDTAFVLDHLAKPPIRARQLEPWRAQISELASLPNVSAKISGLVTEADHERWTPDDLAPYVAHALASFGEDRVMFGGDWPVVTHASSYTRWLGTLAELTASRSAEAQDKLWRRNARRFYRC
ncbi:MAG: amidohydrolase family protein [Chloroflexota bacterium]|nr:amidohydrolase family protein [Chloroflexota bacterium]